MIIESIMVSILVGMILFIVFITYHFIRFNNAFCMKHGYIDWDFSSGGYLPVKDKKGKWHNIKLTEKNMRI